MNQTPLVLKMGGRLLQDQAALDALLKVCAELKTQYPIVLVHAVAIRSISGWPNLVSRLKKLMASGYHQPNKCQ